MAEKNKNNWEYYFVGKFLVKMYLELIIKSENDWKVDKDILRNKFKEYIKMDFNKNSDKSLLLTKARNESLEIWFLLESSNFLLHTADDDYYKVMEFDFKEFRDLLLMKYDVKRIRHPNFISPYLKDVASVASIIDQLEKLSLFEVDDNAQWTKLEYQGLKMSARLMKFKMSNVGCNICQINFKLYGDFEDHVVYHKHEYLKELCTKKEPSFDIIYTTCKNSHYFCFELEKTDLESNYLIEKVVIVQNKNMYSVTDFDNDKFFVDAYIFSPSKEHQILILFYPKHNYGLRYVEQYKFCRNEAFPDVKFKIRPTHLSKTSEFKAEVDLPFYNLPKLMIEAAKSSFPLNLLCELSKDFTEHLVHKELNPFSYKKVMEFLLQTEDAYIWNCYSQFTQPNVKFSLDGCEGKLKMPSRNNITEEITPGDQVLLINIKDEFDKCHGFVQDYDNGVVAIKVDKRIYMDRIYKVIFKPLRLNERYQYRALKSVSAELMSGVIFPKIQPHRSLIHQRPELHNTSIYDNPEQLEAVCNLLTRYRKPQPYILWGPPGTGKTTTLVETIYQLYMRDNGTRILLLSGSNSACDSLALPLCKVFNEKKIDQAIVRVYSRSYGNKCNNIDDIVMEVSNLNGGHFTPSIKTLHNYRIVVCTLSTMGRLSLGYLGQLGLETAYTHVFVDEASSSTELETLLGFAFTYTKSLEALVLAGDPKQLGPVVKCHIAKNFGLAVPLMERLLSMDCYKEDEHGNYNRSIQTRLCRNYRSHPEIVKVYNALYYGNTLKAMASLENVSLCELWHLSCNKKYPIIFHAVYGQSVNLKSASLCNSLELDVVMKYVRDLMYFGIAGTLVNPLDIGIVSPYKQQCSLIKMELNRRNWRDIEVGSAETFQGKEKEIIICSFVRSNTTSLGFVDNPKRLNVMLSRAKSLLIIIGNPTTLSKSPQFVEVIKACKYQHAFIEENENHNIDAKSSTGKNEKKGYLIHWKAARGQKKKMPKQPQIINEVSE